jgi:hypothetical protein
MVVCLREYIAVVPSFMVGVRVRGADERLENEAGCGSQKAETGDDCVFSRRGHSQMMLIVSLSKDAKSLCRFQSAIQDDRR